MTLSGGNEVWRRFIVMQMPEWLAWLKSIHIPSHIRLWSKYVAITTPQKAYSSLGGSSDEEQLLLNFLNLLNLFGNKWRRKLEKITPLRCIVYLYH